MTAKTDWVTGDTVTATLLNELGVAANAGGGGGATNLTSTRTSTTVTVVSDTGTDAALVAADGSNAGVMTAAMQTKLAGVATAATANSADATLLARANHTGTQTAATISDFAAAVATVTANTQTASYTLVLGDAGKAVELNVASANTLTVPPNSSVAFPVGTIIEICQLGAGQTTLTPGAGVTIRSAGLKLKLTNQYSTASLRKRGTDEWVAVGDVSA